MPATTHLEETLLGPVVPGRDCGTCVACCEALEIDTPAITKAAGLACSHSTGSGCAIHPERPEVCRTWFCAWRRIATMPDSTRPDRSGILAFVGFNRDPRNCLEAVYIVAQARDEGVFDTSIGREIVAELSFGLVPLWISDGTTKTLQHPEGDVARYVISGATPPPSLAEDIGAWRTRYDMFRR